MNTIELLIAGFGGQGVLFAGKFLAHLGLIADKQVSWLPSYGPEMRGGTANCSVILSDSPVGSPIVSAPNCLIAMNLPSLVKYGDAVQKNGVLLYDSFLIRDAQIRTDVRTFAVPATAMATEEGLTGLANMVMMGVFLRECLPEALADADAALLELVPPRKAQLVELNRRALALGRAYEG